MKVFSQKMCILINDPDSPTKEHFNRPPSADAEED